MGRRTTAPTAVVEHGANPGLVSHFTKQALTEIATSCSPRDSAGDAPGRSSELALAEGRFNELAMLTGTKVIHIAERDTQITNVPKETNEFVNTWSVEGFYEEGVAPAELGWGTHEKRLPAGAYVHTGYGPRNQICIAQPGMETWVRSWVPVRRDPRHGHPPRRVVHDERPPHGVGRRRRARCRATARRSTTPTTRADVAINSVLELRMRNWEMQPRQRILNDEIIIGSRRARRAAHGPRLHVVVDRLAAVDRRGPGLVPHQNATTLQVAASIVGAVDLDDRQPRSRPAGPRRAALGTGAQGRQEVPRHVPLGTDRLDPADDRATTCSRSGPASRDGLDLDDPWQFTNFLVR